MRDGGRGLLVYRPGAIGDTLLALPALQVARERFKPDRTIFAGAPALKHFLASNDVADLVLSADDSRLLPLFKGDVASLRDTFGSIHAAVVWGANSLSRAVTTFREHGIEVIHGPSRPSDDTAIHVADFLIGSVARLDKRPRRFAYLTPSPQDLAWLGQHYASALARPILALHPGSGSPRKNWSPDYFAALANLAMERMGISIAIISGPADDGLSDQMCSVMQEAPAVTARDWPLGRVAALLHHSTLYVGNDSGISHLAGWLGVPGVALFGPTPPDVWAPLGGSIRSLGQTSMDEHRPDDVLKALQSALWRGPQSRTHWRL